VGSLGEPLSSAPTPPQLFPQIGQLRCHLVPLSLVLFEQGGAQEPQVIP